MNAQNTKWPLHIRALKYKIRSYGRLKSSHHHYHSFLFYISKLLYVTVILYFVHSFSFSPSRRFVFQHLFKPKYRANILYLFDFHCCQHFFSSLRRGDQSTFYCITRQFLIKCISFQVLGLCGNLYIIIELNRSNWMLRAGSDGNGCVCVCVCLSHIQERYWILGTWGDHVNYISTKVNQRLGIPKDQTFITNTHQRTLSEINGLASLRLWWHCVGR